VEPAWKKSSYSVANSACVEVAVSSDNEFVLVRDSKHPDSSILSYPAESWRAFIAELRDDVARRP
jgi:hypothetical protein